MKTPTSSSYRVTITLVTSAAISLLFATWIANALVKGEHRSDLEVDGERTDNPDAALKFRLLSLQDEHGYIPPDGLIRAQAQVRVMKAAAEAKRKASPVAGQPQSPDLGTGSWVWLGPGTVGGRIRSIVIDPVDTNKMWVGSVSGGIWHSTDAGGSWQPVNDFMADLAVSALVMDPTNSTIMYAGTGEGFPGPREIDFNGNYGIRGAGIFKSTDGGVTWDQLANTNPGAPPPQGCGGGGVACQWSYVDRLAISPNGNTLLAATVSNIQRSTDGGANWSAAGGVVGPLLDVAFDPSNSSKAIASGSGGALFSTDSGANWTFATFNPALPGGNPRVEIACARSNSTIVYAAVDSNGGELYRSSNGGQSYTRVNTGTNFYIGANDQGGYDNALWVNPQDSTFLVVGGIDLWRRDRKSVV